MRPVIVSLVLALCCAGAARGQVNGTFRFDNAPTYFPVMPGTVEMHTEGYALCVLDLDGDGDLDTCRTHGGGWLEFARNDDGVLVALPPFVTPTVLGVLAMDVATVDWDQDGIDDLVLAGQRKTSPYPLEFAVLRGDGGGNFAAIVQATVPSTNNFAGFVSLDVADVDGDAKQDAIVSAGAAGVAVLRANGQIVVTPMPAKPWSLRVGDFTGDGAPDVVTLRQVTFPNTLFEVRSSAGGALFATLAASVTTAEQAYGLALDDVDADGDVDAITTMGPVTPYPGRTDLAVLPNQGGQFGAPIVSPCFQSWWPAMSIATGDLDHDGHRDVVVAGASGGGVGMGALATARGDGAGGFVDATALSLYTHEIALADLRGFGVERIVTADQQVVPFDDDGRLGGIRIDGFVDPLAAGVYVSATVLDVNGDGIDDVVAKDAIGSGVARAFVMDGEGRIVQEMQALAPGATLPSFPEWLDHADVDLDGLEDLIVIDGNSLITVANLGGSFAAPTFTGATGCNVGLTIVRRADLDLDGTMDFVVSGDLPCVTAYLGTGTLLFNAVNVALPEPAGSFDLGDFTGDGFPDLLMTGASGKVSLLLGTGVGSVFAPALAPVAFAVPFRGEIRAGDVDGDGDVDAVAYTATSGPQLYVVENVGGGAFALGQGFGTGIAQPGFAVFPGSSLRELSLVDLDGDLDLDVFARREHAFRPFGTIEFARNDAGTFRDAPPGIEIFGTDILSVPRMDLRSGDFDGDGLQDVLVAGFALLGDAPLPTVYLNRSRLASEGRAEAGGRLHFDLHDATAPNKPYVILLSAHGAWPGFFAGAHVPLNYDPVLVPIIASALAPSIFVNFVGAVDSQGRAGADLFVPPMPALPSVLELDAAALIVDPSVAFSFRSTNALRVRVH